MSKRDPAVTLHQIMNHAKEAVDISRGKSRVDLEQDRLLNLALTRLVEIIGEAAYRVPDDIKARYPELPWLEMIGARNRLIHGSSNNADLTLRLPASYLPPL
jgi:uncharacterized protein with HEPN domain